MTNTNKTKDTPYCDIVSEILSTLFLYHTKRSVMTLAIPVTLTFANSPSELIRNTTANFLALAAIHNSRILAQYSVQLINRILKGLSHPFKQHTHPISGNRQLIRVLPQVYPENREPFHAHLAQLLRLLSDSSTEISEKLALLQFVQLIANKSPDLIVPHASDFDELLLNLSTCSCVLHIFLSLINNGRIACLTGQLVPIRRAAQQPMCSQHNLVLMVKIVSVVACTNEKMSVVCASDVIRMCGKLSAQHLANALKEVEGIFSFNSYTKTIL
jgi:hypothetical protein